MNKGYDQILENKKREVERRFAGISRYCKIMALIAGITTIVFIIVLSTDPGDYWAGSILIPFWLAMIIFHLRLSSGLIAKQKWTENTTLIYGYLALFGFPLWTVIGL